MLSLYLGVELQGLTDALSNDFDRRSKLDFDVNVATRADTDDVGGDAVVGATMVFVDERKVQHVALVHRPVGKKKHVLKCFIK
jgi:hypothetical protein